MAGNSLRECFSRLKESISQEVFKHRFSLQQVKDFYRGSIKSDRSVSRANNLDAIFNLLEERCLLSETNVTALYCLGELLEKSDIKKYVKVYCEYFLNNSEPACKVCGLSCGFEEFLDSQLSIQQSHDTNIVNNNNTNNVDELGEALKNVSLNIGRDWKVLARHMELEENILDEICLNNPNNQINQAQSAFNIWRAINPEATILNLDKVLEMRLCKKKGLGIHLRKAPISHTTVLICPSS